VTTLLDGFRFSIIYFTQNNGKNSKKKEVTDELRQNDEPIVKSILNEIQKNHFNKKSFECVETQPSVVLFGISVNDRFTHFKTNELNWLIMSNLKVIYSKLIYEKFPLSNFRAANVPITFTKNQQKTRDFSFIRLAINGNEILSTLGHYRYTALFPFFDREFN
jgi:hypothetical protein